MKVIIYVEALLLASEKSLKQRLRINNLDRSWVIPNGAKKDDRLSPHFKKLA